MSYMLGIDVGTSSAKALVIDEHGNHISVGKAAYDIRIPYEGYAEQDADMLWNAAGDAIRKAVQDPHVRNSIAAVGVTGQMHGIVTLDQSRRPLRPVIIWADHRSAKQTMELKSLAIERRVGNPAGPGLFLPSLLWIKENEPQIYENIKYAVLPKDYIRYKLCGAIGTDASDASGTLLYNVKEENWDTMLMNHFVIDPAILPACHDSCEIAGTITAEGSSQSGLPAGIPVIYGGGDTPMQLVGNGIICDGQLNTNIGTASQINCICSDLSGCDRRINMFHHIPRNTWLAVGAGLNGGIVMKWLQNNILSGFDSFEKMSDAASESKPGANGVVLLPFLNGERSPYMDEEAKAILYGMTLSSNRNDIIRAAMESVVYSFKDCMSVFEEMKLPVNDTIIASGGGAQSPLWLQMQADILQKQVCVTDGEEDASKGAALAAGVGCGLYRSLEEACERTVRMSRVTYEPNPEYRNLFEEQFAIYRSLYQNNRESFHRKRK